MLDPLRPYPDSATDFAPIQISGSEFAITDELGAPLGLTLRMLYSPSLEYLLRIEQPAGDNYGESATLKVDISPAFINGLRLTPSTAYPAHILSIQAQGLSTMLGTQLFSGDVLLDRTITFRFPRTLVKQLSILLYQENYVLNQHSVDPADQVKRATLAQLQAALPFAVQSIAPPGAQLLSGAQYDFGVRDIAGVGSTTNAAANSPGILISGPCDVAGLPEVIRFDAEWNGNVRMYLEVQETYGDGTTSAVAETAIRPASCLPYAPIAPGASSATFWLKFILLEDLSVIQRFLLQVCLQ